MVLSICTKHQQAKARNFPVTSFGSLLDEPFTGVVYLKDSGITTDFKTLKGKRIGYVGEFGKVICNNRLWVYIADDRRSKLMSLPSTTV
jgi:ABC-type nitrate/sulfonate/bicarbonate transport system substrate-binding protein